MGIGAAALPGCADAHEVSPKRPGNNATKINILMQFPITEIDNHPAATAESAAIPADPATPFLDCPEGKWVWGAVEEAIPQTPGL